MNKIMERIVVLGLFLFHLSACTTLEKADNNMAKKAEVVLRVECADPGAGNKYHWQKVKILKIIKNNSNYNFPDQLEVAHYGWEKGIPVGISTIYLERYDPYRDDLWKLLEGKLERMLEYPPSIDLITGNIRDTNSTVVLKIIDISESGSLFDLNIFEVKARVLKCYKGDLQKGQTFQYYYSMEKGSELPKIGSKHIVSFTKKGNKYGIRGNAYHFEYSKWLDKKFKFAQKKILSQPNK